MILCKFSELKKYKAVLPELESALECLESVRKQGFPTGNYDYESGCISVQRGTTKPFAKDEYETHKKYIDIHYMVEGYEETYVAHITDLQLNKAYSEKDDIAFYTKEGKRGSMLQIREGMCSILFPEDGHMACRSEDEFFDYVKIVIKLPCR